MKVFLAIVACILIVLAYDVVRLYVLIKKSAVLVQNAVAFSQAVENPSVRILILGDSTAVGTGAQMREGTIAGRIGARYPDAEVVNLAVNGLRIEGLLKILDTLQAEDKFDIVLIQIGANDIIRLTPLADIDSGIANVLEQSASLGKKVIVLHSGDVGDAPFFPVYVRPLLSSRSAAVREMYIQKSELYGARYVDLMRSTVSKTIASDISRYHAPDLLHLTADGYGLWFGEIEKHL
jgi:lysophospholipase L1-like esterase